MLTNNERGTKMFIQQEISVYDLQDLLWSGGLDTWNRILEEDKEDEAMQLIIDTFGFTALDTTITNINDFLWFDRDFIFEALNITDEEEE